MLDLDIRRIFLIETSSKDKILHKAYRILTVGLSGYLVEWDLLLMKPKHVYQNPGGAIWDACLSSTKEEIFLASHDGCVRVIDIRKGFFLQKQYAKSDSPAVSVAAILDENLKEVICSGHMCGAINKWENGVLHSTFGNKAYKINKKKVKRNLSDIESMLENETGDEDRTELETNEEELRQSKEQIWRLHFITSKYLASGNAKGILQIWDIKFGVLYAQFKEHDHDILAIAFNKSLNTLYFSGVDSLVCSVSFIDSSFKITSKIRPQSHDISSLIAVNGELLLSGGLTTDICLINLVKGRFIEKFDKKTNSNI